jgi:uncharacterized protein YjbI with pentapeptide repeats
MKKYSLLTLTFLMVIAFGVYAQSTVSGKQIAKAAKKGEDITYENISVKGMLDFTNYTEAKDNLPVKSWKWWSYGDTEKDERFIGGKIIFKNCTFEDDVIAYIVENDKYLFIASFEREVVFENCTFKGAAAFKYSDFDKRVSFRGSKFDEEANFKYAKFNREADFSKINSRHDANFKYAKFRQGADFSGSVVRSEANFKYAKFYKGLDLQNADFNGLLNFKYVNIDGELNTRSARINDLDIKYAKVNGSSFHKYLLSSRD